MNASTTESARAGDDVTRDPLGLQPADELARRWRSGERAMAEEFLAAHPRLQQSPEAAVELIYEEFCARDAAGESGAEQDILRRFPQWAAPLRLMLECHRRIVEDQRHPKFPAVGERLGDFRLTEQLAGGGHGRVYVARQGALADRPVVLKVTPLHGGEHLTLARLQHTHVVPLYSAADDVAQGLRVLVMPYFGRATLAAVLRELDPTPLPQRTGRDLADAIVRLNRSGPAVKALKPPASTLDKLARASYAQSLAWIAACLADALQHAHERGLVHLDVKPSNVLLAEDGQPMLLDFHLARCPILPGSPPMEDVGGTPAYMPPEQRSAMQMLREGRPVEDAVDARADVYALGAMLYEALGGHLPVEPDSLPVGRLNPQVSPGLSDVVAKCLATSPEDRYPSASALADDLRRHLNHRPLAGVPNRSLAERWSKWRRRKPAALRAAAMLVLSLAAAAALVAGTWANLGDSRRQAELALQQGQRQIDAGQFHEAVQTLDRGLAACARLPFQSALSRQLRERLQNARRLELRSGVHRLADATRALYPADSLPAERLRALASECTALWAKRDALLVSSNTADGQVIADLRDIGIFAAASWARLATTSGSPADPLKAARILDEAEASLGRSPVLDREREVNHIAPASTTAPAAGPAVPTGPRDRVALGRAYLASGDLPRYA